MAATQLYSRDSDFGEVAFAAPRVPCKVVAKLIFRGRCMYGSDSDTQIEMQGI